MNLITYFSIIIPVLWFCFLKFINGLYRSLYNKLGDIELRLVDIEAKINDKNC